MNATLKDYRPLVVFLAKFGASYIILSAIYYGYLSQYNESLLQVDSFTEIVANQTKSVVSIFNQNVSFDKHPNQAAFRIFYNNKFVARVVEGCNGISVAILFAAFVIAFKGKLWQTVSFILFGTLLIHILNVARIALLAALLFHYPEYEHILHGVVFPGIIYSIVFILWVVWINKFSTFANAK